MKMNKKGMTFEQIVLFILAIVVLLTVIVYFTGTFRNLQTPVNTVIGSIECKQICAVDDAAHQASYAAKGCEAILGKTFADCKSAA